MVISISHAGAGDDAVAASMVLTNAITDVCGGDAGLHLIVLWKCTP